MAICFPLQAPGRHQIIYRRRLPGRLWYISRASSAFRVRATIRPSRGFGNCTLELAKPGTRGNKRRAMSATRPKSAATHLLEPSAIVLAAVGCIALTIAIWRNISANQAMWPLPGLYFVELPAISLAAAVGWKLDLSWARVVTWAALGIVLAFCILGALSVGMLYLPVALLLAVAVISSDLKEAQPIMIHLAICLGAAIAQAALMLLAIRLLYSSAVF